MFNIHLHRDEIYAISNALNTEAGHFDLLCGDDRFTHTTKTVFRGKAAHNRELSAKLIDACALHKAV